MVALVETCFLLTVIVETELTVSRVVTMIVSFGLLITFVVVTVTSEVIGTLKYLVLVVVRSC